MIVYDDLLLVGEIVIYIFDPDPGIVSPDWVLNTNVSSENLDVYEPIGRPAWKAAFLGCCSGPKLSDTRQTGLDGIKHFHFDSHNFHRVAM